MEEKIEHVAENDVFNIRKKYSHPKVQVPKELSLINGKINDMKERTLIKKLEHFELDTKGSIPVKKKRLKNFYKTKLMSENNLVVISKLYPYYVVVDFEATCESINPPNFPHEIIEFPGVLVDSQKQEIIDEFHRYVKPKLNPKLTTFCTELTGITQDVVDKADYFPAVYKEFEQWLKKHELGTEHKFAIVTDGPWDMARFLYFQCKMSGVPFPDYAKRWINLRKPFKNYYSCQLVNLQRMLKYLGITFEGRHHSGMDDARNIANILIHLIKDGASLEINETIHSKCRQKHNYNHRNQKNHDQKQKNQERQKQSISPIQNEEDIAFALNMLSIQTEGKFSKDIQSNKGKYGKLFIRGQQTSE